MKCWVIRFAEVWEVPLKLRLNYKKKTKYLRFWSGKETKRFCALTNRIEKGCGPADRTGIARSSGKGETSTFGQAGVKGVQMRAMKGPKKAHGKFPFAGLNLKASQTIGVEARGGEEKDVEVTEWKNQKKKNCWQSGYTWEKKDGGPA